MEEKDSLGVKLLIAKLICWGLFAFDVLLGSASLLSPRAVLKSFAPGEEPAGEALLRRAGSIWLFFVPVQLWAALKTENPKALRAVSVLRLQEVPADPVWLATGKGFGAFGKFGLVFAPAFNLVAGSYLAYVAGALEKKSAQNND